MHLPDGFLSDPTCAVTTIVAGAAVGTGLARLRSDRSPADVSSMAIVGAGVFAAQMVNFPVDHGTSGHVLGAAVAAIVLGPWAAITAMTVVLVAQCLLFADGGLSTLGANVLNMGVVAVLASAGVFSVARRLLPGRVGMVAAAALAAWVSVMAAAAACSLELAASGTYSLAEVLSAMSRVHAAIGLGEALVTAGVVGLVAASAPGMLESSASSDGFGRRRLGLLALFAAVLVVVSLAPIASTAPDGLERVAEDLQFASLAKIWSATAVAPDYIAPGVTWQPLAIALAGILGIATVYASAYGLGRAALARVRKV